MLFHFAASRDFNTQAIVLTIPASTPGDPACIDLRRTITDDDIIEATENFFVNIVQVDPPTVTITNGDCEVFIEDKDGECFFAAFTSAVCIKNSRLLEECSQHCGTCLSNTMS